MLFYLLLWVKSIDGGNVGMAAVYRPSSNMLCVSFYTSTLYHHTYLIDLSSNETFKPVKVLIWKGKKGQYLHELSEFSSSTEENLQFIGNLLSRLTVALNYCFVAVGDDKFIYILMPDKKLVPITSINMFINQWLLHSYWEMVSYKLASIFTGTVPPFLLFTFVIGFFVKVSSVKGHFDFMSVRNHFKHSSVEIMVLFTNYCKLVIISIAYAQTGPSRPTCFNH